jgi:hypothetical protein
MFTKRASVAALCIAVAAALLSPAAFSDPVELRLSIAGQEFPVGEEIEATVALVNVSEKAVSTALMLSEYNGRTFLSFEVLYLSGGTGGPLSYYGEQWSMAFETIPIQEIPAGGRVEKSVPLARLYQLRQPGEYEVRAVYRQLEAKYLEKYKKPNVITDVLRSEPVRITVTDNNRIFQNTIEVPYEENDDEGNPRSVVTRLTVRVYKTSAGNRVYYECSRPPDLPRRDFDGITDWGTILDGALPVFAVGDMSGRPSPRNAINVLLRDKKDRCCHYVLRPDGRKDEWRHHTVPPDLKKGVGLVQWENGEVEIVMK